MTKENHWSLGKKDFVYPDLPASLKGRQGCFLQSLTIDSAIGDEICAVYLEDSHRGSHVGFQGRADSFCSS
jgi:hypothetical protein